MMRFACGGHDLLNADLLDTSSPPAIRAGTSPAPTIKMDKHESRIKKATTHIVQNEGLLFEQSRAGRIGYSIPELDVPASDESELINASLLRNDDLEGMPELSEVDVIRHFTRLSTWNYCIDHGLYPLGSCTMKYNPRINEAVAR